MIGKTRPLTLASSARVAIDPGAATTFMQNTILAVQSKFGRTDDLLRSLKSRYALSLLTTTKVLQRRIHL